MKNLYTHTHSLCVRLWRKKGRAGLECGGGGGGGGLSRPHPHCCGERSAVAQAASSAWETQLLKILSLARACWPPSLKGEGVGDTPTLEEHPPTPPSFSSPTTTTAPPGEGWQGRKLWGWWGVRGSGAEAVPRGGAPFVGRDPGGWGPRMDDCLFSVFIFLFTLGEGANITSVSYSTYTHTHCTAHTHTYCTGCVHTHTHTAQGAHTHTVTHVEVLSRRTLLLSFITIL